jgi:hypothetical protein
VGTLPDGSKARSPHFRFKGINQDAIINKSMEFKGDSDCEQIFNVYSALLNDKTIKFVLNPGDKPSFKYDSPGVSLREPGTFTREVNYKNIETINNEIEEANQLIKLFTVSKAKKNDINNTDKAIKLIGPPNRFY